MNDSASKYNPEDWEEVRLQFSRSMMVGIKLNSLAENLGTEWPISGSEETPAKYINLSFEEMQMLPEIQGKPKRLELLIDILKETLAFDDPFGEMVGQIEQDAESQNDILKALQKLEIPEDYPIAMSNISSETKEFCKNEGIKTIGEFVRFCQNMAKNIVIGGDYRSFLNNLAHLDERGIAKVLPIRVGSKGLHLQEAVGLAVERLQDAERYALYRKYGGKLTPEQEATARQVQDDTLRKLESRLQDQIREQMALFPEERNQITVKLANGESIEREFMYLDDPLKERIAVGALTAAMGDQPGMRRQKKGLFQRLFGRD